MHTAPAGPLSLPPWPQPAGPNLQGGGHWPGDPSFKMRRDPAQFPAGPGARRVRGARQAPAHWPDMPRSLAKLHQAATGTAGGQCQWGPGGGGQLRDLPLPVGT